MTPMLTMTLKELRESPGVAEELTRGYLDNLVDTYVRLASLNDEQSEDFAEGGGKVHVTRLGGDAEVLHWTDITLLDVPDMLATLAQMEAEYNKRRGLEALWE
jgi:hypothetical protein